MRSRKLERIGRLLATLDVGLELGAELPDGELDRPAGAVRQAADGRPRHDANPVADLLEDGQVVVPALPAADAVDDLVHPARALAAGRALPAGLVIEEAADVVEH